MLEKYFMKPATVDQYRGSWLGTELEQYVSWLTDHDYRPRTILSRLPIALAFGEFSRQQGATTASELPEYVEAFVLARVARHHDLTGSDRLIAKEIRGPVEQFLTVVLADFEPSGRPSLGAPFGDVAPDFFDYLVEERGLRSSSVKLYRHHLNRFSSYLEGIQLGSLQDLSPTILSAFIVDRAGAGISRSSVRSSAGIVRVFLRYLHRQGVLDKDLSTAVGWPQVYRLSTVPRSISWEDVNRILDTVDRRAEVGRRDYAILLLLVTYGLRSREIAAMTLDDIDWRTSRLTIPDRKAGHSTAFPLSSVVGEAIVDYLQNGRPATEDRHVFLRVVAPRQPIGAAAISGIARRYILAAGIHVPRPGSHTLRHSAVQRLVDADFDLKTIGDFIGHRSSRSTEVYAKVGIETLREVSMGDGEEILP